MRYEGDRAGQDTDDQHRADDRGEQVRDIEFCIRPGTAASLMVLVTGMDERSRLQTRQSNPLRRSRLRQAHYPITGDDHCPRCRTWWGGRRRWPCQVWRDEARRSLVVTRTARSAPAPAGRGGQPGIALSGYRTPFSWWCVVSTPGETFNTALPRWGLSPLDWHAHAINEWADHPVGLYIARAGTGC